MEKGNPAGRGNGKTAGIAGIAEAVELSLSDQYTENIGDVMVYVIEQSPVKMYEANDSCYGSKSDN